MMKTMEKVQALVDREDQQGDKATENARSCIAM